MKTYALCIASLSLSGCVALPVENASWCPRKGGITLSVPLERGVPYHPERCRAREVLNRILK